VQEKIVYVPQRQEDNGVNNKIKYIIFERFVENYSNLFLKVRRIRSMQRRIKDRQSNSLRIRVIM